MNRNTKKGFTIVELIIVIAVIAVLAAVLIPTFSNLIGKAQEAKDTALVRNLNEALAMDTTTSKHLTMSDAVAAVRNNGIDISKIKATVPGNAILWDSVNDLFAYYKVDKEGNSGDKVYYIPEYSADAPADGRLFAVVSDSNAIATSKYGVYYTGSNVDSVTVNGVGFDAGSAQIGTVVYNGSTSGATVDIRTNGGALTINAANDTIRHHNTVLNVNIVAVAQNSYHEFGTVEGTLYVKEGRVSVESTGSVSSLVVTAEKTNIGSVKVEATGTIGAIGATDSEVAKDLKNNTNIKAGNADVVETPVTDSENSVFAGGLGTEKSPFLIANETQFAHIEDLSESMKDGKAYYFKLTDNIDLSKLSARNNISEYFCGSLDGNNYKVITNDSMHGVDNGDDASLAVFAKVVGNSTFKNIIVSFKTERVYLTYGGVANSTVTYDNVDVTTEDDATKIYLGTNGGIYRSYVNYIGTSQDNTTLIFKNCDAKLDISATSYNAVFIGGYASRACLVKIDDCSYSGMYIGEKVSPILGNASLSEKYTIEVNGFNIYGSISGTTRAVIFAASADVKSNKMTYNNCNFTGLSKLDDSKLGLTLSSDGITINESSFVNASYVLKITAGKLQKFRAEKGTNNYIKEESEQSSYSFSIKISPEFNNGTAKVALYNGKFVTKEQYDSLGIAESASKYQAGSKFDIENTNDTVTLVNIGTEEAPEYYYVFQFETIEYKENGKTFVTKNVFGKTVNNEFVSEAVNVNAITVYSYLGNELKGAATIQVK